MLATLGRFCRARDDFAEHRQECGEKDAFVDWRQIHTVLGSPPRGTKVPLFLQACNKD